MSPFRLARCVAAAVTIGVAGVCLSLPAMADTPVTVTFQPGNPWTQEVGSVTRYENYHDYTVAIAANKTFQINLVTRNPNVFFKVKDETHDQKLVDTYKTGAMTWSTHTTAPTTYTIHVYVIPDAMSRGEAPKYALQIGQYGAADMQPASTTETFQNNQPWVQESSIVDANATAHDYMVAIAAGKTMKVNLIAQDHNLHFKVKDQAGNTQLVDTGTTGATTWTTSTPTTAVTNYTIEVYVDPTAMPPGHKAAYTLQIGQYQTNSAQPATPASAGTAVPTPAASAGAAAPTSSANR